jgi:small subunit ribosomal protein S16
MAVKIRLTRLGKKKQATYRVVVMDSRKQRDGQYIEQLGVYDPRQDPSLITIDNERALHWLKTGAQPTERAQKLLEISGAWTQFKIAKGDIHTVGGDEPAPKPKKAAKAVEATDVVTEDVADGSAPDAVDEAATDADTAATEVAIEDSQEDA